MLITFLNNFFSSYPVVLSNSFKLEYNKRKNKNYITWLTHFNAKQYLRYNISQRCVQIPKRLFFFGYKVGDNSRELLEDFIREYGNITCLNRKLPKDILEAEFYLF